MNGRTFGSSDGGSERRDAERAGEDAKVPEPSPPTGDRIRDLEAELERARQEWNVHAERKSRLGGPDQGRLRLGRGTGEAGQIEADFRKANLAYAEAWRKLERAREDAMPSPPAAAAEPEPAPEPPSVSRAAQITASIEAKLVAARRRLEQAEGRAADAERRASELELALRREQAGAVEREKRVRELEERLREMSARPRGTVERDQATEGRLRARPPAAALATVPRPAPDSLIALGPVSLSNADFDELRQLGMSVTQATRVIRYCDEHGGFSTVDELSQVPGFSRVFVRGVIDRLTP